MTKKKYSVNVKNVKTDRQANNRHRPSDQKFLPKNYFKDGYIALEMLEWIRDLGIDVSYMKTRRKEYVSWSQTDKEELFEAIKKICEYVILIIQKEDRCLRLNSPINILGDIHGNLKDLLTYERFLWPTGPTKNTACTLFLGDYVDRGEFSLECIMYLLCCKAIAPSRYFLLRGNHELRPIQAAFTFQKECLDKLGPQMGSDIWETLNQIFDVLPLSANIDESIFCAHGGIPTTAPKLEFLSKIPNPISDPEAQSPLAWEVLWNDPVSSTSHEFAESAEVLRAQGGTSSFRQLRGFLPNTKRGTAFFFSEEAVDRFLQVNGLSHIIRAHELVRNGYEFIMGGKVITIFSSSHYCGSDNDGATVYIEGDRIIVTRYTQ